MFAWETKAKEVFKDSLDADLFAPTKGLAANQGLYNGFLAVGLLWTFFISNPIWKINISLFFLSLIIVAGIFGGISISKKIFYIQTIPAIIALTLALIV